MRSLKTLSRAALGALLGLLTVAGVAGPAAAIGGPTAPPVMPGAAVAGVHAEVNPGTPLFNVEIVFDGITGVNCADARGAVLNWQISTTGRGTPSGPRGYRSGALDLCRDGRTGPVTTDRMYFKVFNSDQGGPNVLPNEQLDVYAALYYKSQNVSANFTYTKISRTDAAVTMPKAPIWIGVGDGYTSAVVQGSPICAFSNTACSTGLDQPAASWVQVAVDALNAQEGVTDVWAIKPVILASVPTKAGDLSATHAQVTQMVTRLAALAPAAGSPQPGSWNWVGMTAGLVDSGIINALQNQTTGWYATTSGSLNTTGTSPNPWDVTTAAACPNFSTVASTVNANKASIQNGVVSVFKAALDTDPNVRIVHPIYPYFAESGSNNGYTNPCRATNVAAVDSLDSVLTHAGLSTVATNQGVDMGHVFDIDLRQAFDPRPTGQRGTGTPVVRDSSLIQLTKPWGFPYPTADGAGTIGAAVVAVINGQADDLPPTVVPRMERDADAPTSGWYNKPVTVFWDTSDPAGGDIQVDPTLVDVEGRNFVTSPPVVSPVSGLAADPVTQQVPVDMTPPLAGFRGTNAAGAAIDPNANGWYNVPVTLYWQFGGNPCNFETPDQCSQLDPTSVPSGTAPAVTNLNNVAAWDVAVPPNAMCDMARNCALRSVPISVDTVAPVVTARPSIAAPTSGWYNAATGVPVINWDVTDALSGLDGDLPTATALPLTGGTVADGTYTVSGPVVYDKAGNASTIATTVVKVDRTAPQVKLTGVVGSTVSDILEGIQFPTGGLPSSISCAATDAGGSNLKGTCTATLTGTSVLAGGLGTAYTYKVSATDNAGNVTSYDVHFSALGVVNVNPPTITGTVSSQPNSDGWYNKPVTITWSYQEGSPSGGISQAAKDAFNAGKTVVVNTDGKSISTTSPALCDNSVPAKCATRPTIKVNLDQVKPTITITNITDGARYTKASTVPTPGCTGTDALSGFKSCTVTSSWASLPAYGPPGKLYTVTATGTDYAGNVGTSAAVTYTVFDITPKTDGRMTGSGQISGSNTQAEFTLRCNGSPNQLDVEWTSGEFDLDTISSIYCWDDSRYSEGSPDAPIDSLWATGTGTLKNGQKATIEFTLTDQGESGCGRDTLSFVIKDLNGNVILSSSGKLTGGGNVQAHDSTGNGTNNNGHVNGPNGHYDNDGYDRSGYDRDGYDRDGYDRDGYDREGCDKRGYDRNGVRRKSSWGGYDRNGRDDDGYDRNGYDRNGYNRSGYNRAGYDSHGYDRDGQDRDGCDRNGYDGRGTKRKYGSRR